MPTKIESPKPAVILDRTALVAAIRKINPEFSERGDQSMDYLRGYYSHAAQPTGGEVFKNGDPLNPGPHSAKLDESEIRRLASVQEVRIRNATRWCTTPEQRSSAIARLDSVDREQELRAQERDERMGARDGAAALASTHLDSTSEVSPVVKAQIASIERGQARSRGAIDKNTAWGTDSNDPKSAA